MSPRRAVGMLALLAAVPLCTRPAWSFTAPPGPGQLVQGPVGARSRCVRPARPAVSVQPGAGSAGGRERRLSLCRIILRASPSRDGAGPSAEEFYGKAAQILTEAGGMLDALSFGRRWKKTHPDDDIEQYKGPGVSTIAQLLSLSPRFTVSGRTGSSTKTFALAKQLVEDSVPGTANSVERRNSTRGYAFSVINKRGSNTKFRPDSYPSKAASRTYPGADVRLRSGEGDIEPAESVTSEGVKRGGQTSGAAKLIDVWSQAATLSDADETGRQEQQAMALIRSAGARPDALPYTRLINEHARAATKGDRSALSRAFQVLEDMEDDGVEPNKITYTALITACAKAAGAGLGSMAVDRGVLVLEKMVEGGLEIDTVTYNALLDACAKAAASPSADAMSALEMGFSLLSRMEEEGPRPDYITYNTLMHACAKAAAFPPRGAECMERALELLDRMEAAAVPPQVMTYNALVDACARAGKGFEGIDLALSLLQRMEASGLQPDAVTYNSLINTCARAAESGSHAFQAALTVLNRMEVSGVRPNVVTFNSLATIIARTAQAGDIIDPGAASSQGQQVLGMLLGAEVKPNVVTLNALLSAVVSAGIAGNERSDDDVEELLDMLLQLGVQPNMVTFNQVLESVQHAQALETCEDGSPKSTPVASENGTWVRGGEARTRVEVRWVKGDPEVDDMMEALDILEGGGGINSAILGHVEDLVQRSKHRVLHLLPLLRRIVAMGARPQLPFYHALLNRCMSFGGDGLAESIALCDIMYQTGVEFTSQTEAIADRIRQAHDDDPELAGLEAWDLITPEIRGEEEEEEEGGEEDWIEVREMTPETRRVLLKHSSVASSLDTLPNLLADDWEQEGEWMDADGLGFD